MNELTAPSPAKDIVTIPAADPANVQLVAANQRVKAIASDESPGFAPVSSLPVEMTGDRSAEYHWGEQIKSAWQKSVEGIIECGRLLIQAKGALPHGRFQDMVEAELPFNVRAAERLMAIAQDARLTNPTHVSLLPPHWGTLYELTRLDDDIFEGKLKDGTIHPEMTRKDAAPPREKKAPDRARQFINLIDRCWEVVDDLDAVPDDVKVALEHLESYKRKLQAEAQQRKAEQKAERKAKTEQRSASRKASPKKTRPQTQQSIEKASQPSTQQAADAVPQTNKRIYVAEIDGEAVITFAALGDDEARTMVSDRDGGIRQGLAKLLRVDGRAVWDGRTEIGSRPATASEHQKWVKEFEEVGGSINNDPDAFAVTNLIPVRTPVDILESEQGALP
jgi:hypothetical protein